MVLEVTDLPLDAFDGPLEEGFNIVILLSQLAGGGLCLYLLFTYCMSAVRVCVEQECVRVAVPPAVCGLRLCL